MPAGSGASGKSWHSEDRTGRWDGAWWGASQERRLIFLSGSYFSQLFPFSLTGGRAGTGSVGFLVPAVMELTGAESRGGSPSAPSPLVCALSAPQAPLSTSQPSRDLFEFTG